DTMSTSWHLACLFTRSVLLAFFFFFSSRRRHTRSLRDWSSDVCSSDLATVSLMGADRSAPISDTVAADGARRVEVANTEGIHHRSEERRVGKECRSRWAPEQ